MILGGGQDVRGREEAAEADGVPRELVHAPLFAVDDADRGAALEARIAERLHGRKRGPARRDDVLHEANALAWLKHAFEPIRGSVVLCVLANDEKRKPRLERRRGRERDGAELWPGDAHGLRLVLADQPREPFA